MSDLVLVLNCGSSSIKFALFDAGVQPLPRQPLWNGKVDGISGPAPTFGETGVAPGPLALDAAALCKMADRGQITGGLLDGPLAFDNAVSIAAARTKGIVSEVAGRADILVVPDLESGNMLAKQLEYLAGASGSGIVLGARVPIALTSRSDGPTARVASALLAVLVAYDARRVRAPKAAAPIKD